MLRFKKIFILKIWRLFDNLKFGQFKEFREQILANVCLTLLLVHRGRGGYGLASHIPEAICLHPLPLKNKQFCAQPASFFRNNCPHILPVLSHFVRHDIETPPPKKKPKVCLQYLIFGSSISKPHFWVIHVQHPHFRDTCLRPTQNFRK